MTTCLAFSGSCCTSEQLAAMEQTQTSTWVIWLVHYTLMSHEAKFRDTPQKIGNLAFG